MSDNRKTYVNNEDKVRHKKLIIIKYVDLTLKSIKNYSFKSIYFQLKKFVIK